MRFWISSLLLAMSTGSLAVDVSGIELRRLFDPTPAELQAEASGRIYIYDGLRDIDIERAMDKEFNRVDSMMFIRLKKTDEEGEVRRDPESGNAMVEDDGC
jgi:hypothetical protein